MSRSLSIPKPTRPDVIYPDSDGKPMAENTLQFRWIVTIKEGTESVFTDDADVFVAGDLLWYPVEGNPKICAAPDTLVAFGRPKGYRGSYIQFKEGGIAPQVVFEVLSPNNTPAEMTDKLGFYEKYGVEEYYVYDPDNIKLTGHLRNDGKLKAIAEMNGWVSPRLGVRFDLSGPELQLFGPDGKRFLTYQELVKERDRVTAERDRATAERDRATAERDRITAERDAERERNERLVAHFRALGIEPPA